jgi:hypothetical protein
MTPRYCMWTSAEPPSVNKSRRGRWSSGCKSPSPPFRGRGRGPRSGRLRWAVLRTGSSAPSPCPLPRPAGERVSRCRLREISLTNFRKDSAGIFPGQTCSGRGSGGSCRRARAGWWRPQRRASVLVGGALVGRGGLVVVIQQAPQAKRADLTFPARACAARGIERTQKGYGGGGPQPWRSHSWSAQFL